MSTEKPTGQIEKSDSRKPSLKKTLGTAAATLAAGGAVMLGANQLHTAAEREQLQQELVAAEAIALGYNCEILRIDDTHVHPSNVQLPNQLKDGSLRTTVDITIRMQKRPDAIPYFEKYENDTAVQWSRIEPKGLMHVSRNGETIPMTVSDFNPELNDLQLDEASNSAAREVTIPFYPRTEYPNETLVDIVMEQRVSVSDDDKNYRTIGTIPCGTMKIFNGVWGMSGVPSELKPTTRTEIGSWQKSS